MIARRTLLAAAALAPLPGSAIIPALPDLGETMPADAPRIIGGRSRSLVPNPADPAELNSTMHRLANIAVDAEHQKRQRDAMDRRFYELTGWTCQDLDPHLEAAADAVPPFTAAERRQLVAEVVGRLRAMPGTGSLDDRISAALDATLGEIA